MGVLQVGGKAGEGVPVNEKHQAILFLFCGWRRICDCRVGCIFTTGVRVQYALSSGDDTRFHCFHNDKLVFGTNDHIQGFEISKAEDERSRAGFFGKRHWVGI